ncbi:MAG: DUF115 domain-containing protein [Nitrospirae bacterium]|nr:MAG: DUF115 domain-containing protein [Nitrospirota bacterium]
MKATACLICGASDGELLVRYEQDPYHRHLDHLHETPVTYVVCRRCGFVYTNPMLDEQELTTLYGDKLRPHAPDPAYLKANRKVYLARYQWVAKELGLPQDGQPAPSLLEVGCAAGVALSVFREYGWQVCGIEPADTFASHARESFGLDVQTGFYGPGSYEGRTFDLIMFSQVLEHVPDPDALLRQARINLKDDGHVFIGVPTLMRPLRPVHPQTLQAVHLWIFSLPTLRLLLERNGLTPVAQTYDHKGLLVLAKKAEVRTGWREGAGDSPERVIRYFREFTAEDGQYARNLAALKSINKDRGRPPDLDADLSAVTVEQTSSGYLNLCERTHGEPRHLYDRDPRDIARRVVERMDFGVEGVVVLLGLGLGYLATEVLSRLNRGHVLIVCEADPRIFHAAMFHQDLTGLLNDERVHLVVGDDLPRLDYILSLCSKPMFVTDKLRIVRCGFSARWHQTLYARYEERVKERMKVLEINRNTIGGLGLRMLKNVLDNAHLTLDMPGVARFTGLFKGKPAIIVSAGPSLEANFDLLRDAKGRAVIIACDTVLRMLVPNGIVPDITITADPHEMTYRKFRDLPMDPDSILICHPANYPDIFRTFAGRRFTTDTHLTLYKFLSRFWASKGRVDHRSQSSAHQAFNAATLLGADPIIFVGQDLCFYRDKKHAGNLTKESPSSVTGTPQDREQAVDILGRPVETSTLFRSFKIILEDMIRESPARVINATEGGLGLKGSEVLTLRDALAECCPVEPIGVAERFASVSKDAPGETDRAGLRAEVARIDAEAKETLKVAQKMLTYVERAERVIQRGKENSKRAEYLSEMAERQSQLMEGRHELMGLLVEGAYLLELYMTRESTLSIDQIADPKERFKRQIERALTYYRGLKDALTPFAEGTKLLLQRLDEVERLLGLPSETVEQRLQIALGYKQLMDYPRAQELYRRLIEEAPQHLEALFHLGDILYRCHRPHEALPLLKQVAARAPRYMNVGELIRLCREKTDAWAVKTAEARAVLESRAQRLSGADALRAEAEFYRLAGDRTRAERKLTEAIRVAPTGPEAYISLARHYEATGDLQAVVAVFEEGLTACPESPSLLKELGLFSLRHDQVHQGAEFLCAAAALDPSLCEEAGDLLYQVSCYMSAGELFEQALRRHPENVALILKAAAAYRQATTTAKPALAMEGR